MTPNCIDIDCLGPWVWKLIGHGEFYPQGKSCMGYIGADTMPKWAVIFDDYEEGGSIYMHFACSDPKSVSRRAICEVFEYPFCQLGVKKVLATINSENVPSLSFVIRLGFQVEALISDAYEMGDMYILSMARDECRWLRGKGYGQECQAATAA